MAATAQKLKPETTPPEKQPPKLAQLWAKTGLDGKTLSMMFKGSVPPTVAIAMYQSSAVAGHFGVLGYLIAITSILGFAIMPRGVFIQTMSLNLLTVCLASAVNLLALYSITQARAHTTTPGTPPTAYNSSASAVSAIWLIAQVYLINYLRAARPQFQFPAIIYSIFVMVLMSYAPTMPTMTYAISFVENLLEAFLVGFGLAIATQFLIFPVGSRQVVFAEMTGYTKCLSGVLKAQTMYMHSLEDFDPVAQQHRYEEAEEDHSKHPSHKNLENTNPLKTPAGEALKGAMMKALALHAKINGDIAPAKRDFAIGKLEAKDISELWRALRMTLTPIMGLMSTLDILRRRAEERHWTSSDLPEEEMKRNQQQIEVLRGLMKTLRKPFASMTETIDSGFTHVLITLELVKQPKKRNADEESTSGENGPGSAAFAGAFKNKLDEFENSRKVTLQDWCKEKGIELPPDAFDDSFEATDTAQVPQGVQRHVFLMLYLEYLLWRAGRAVLDVVLLAEGYKQDGKMKQSKLIFPGSKTLHKWIRATFGREDLSQDDHFLTDLEVGASESMYLGQSFSQGKDPEHLPPRNTWERIGNVIRLIPKFFRTDASSFGFRVACATMSVAIIGFLQSTQVFFQQQRLLWGMIMIAISMTRTAGQSTFNFILRVVGTAIALVGAFLVWYIVDGKVPGVIVLLWLWIFAGYYVLLKFPKYVVVAILSIVTAILIIGYELEVDKLGVAAAEANGQPAYPTYLLAPYRLAVVAGGLFVAWVWTIWPFPVSEHSELRRDIGASLYLLANFYSIVHETVRARTRGVEGDVNRKGTHAFNLEKAKVKVFTKFVALLSQMQTKSAFSKFQVRVGGRFPREEYEGMLECVRRIFSSIALMTYASDTFSTVELPADQRSEWSNNFRRLVLSANITSHSVTSILSLLSASVTNGQPLPPYLQMPRPFEFLEKLQAMDRDVLSVRHMIEPEYSAFVVVNFCAEALSSDLAKVAQHVRALIGEMDFSFHAVTTSEQSSNSSVDSQDLKEKPQ